MEFKGYSSPRFAGDSNANRKVLDVLVAVRLLPRLVDLVFELMELKPSPRFKTTPSAALIIVFHTFVIS